MFEIFITEDNCIAGKGDFIGHRFSFGEKNEAGE
jgi:hypothetical protein